MRPELETYQRIDSYLNGKLEGDALRVFENQLLTDPAFAEEVSFQQLTNEVVIGASYDDLRSQMTQDIDRIDTADKTRRWSLYTVAAFILITGTVSIYSYLPTKSIIKKHTVQNSGQSVTSAVSTKTSDATTTENLKTLSQKEPQSNTLNKKEIIGVAKSDTQTISSPTYQVKQQHVTVDKATTEDKLIQPLEKNTSVNPCLNTQIVAVITTTPTCANENTGSILIPSTQLHGGTNPYTISLDHSLNKPLQESYLYVSSGSHTVLITDKNGCSKEFHVSIEEKNCRKNSYVFAPEKGETWKISGTDTDDFTITIINISGTQVYKSSIMQGEFEWQGIGQHGEYLIAGLYIYVIEYTSGQKENGQITIVR